MEVTQEGKDYYRDAIVIFFKSIKLDKMTKSLLDFIIEKVSEYEGNEDLLIHVPVSIILDAEKAPKNEWHRIISDTVNNFMDSHLLAESNCGCNHIGTLSIINYYHYKEGESFFDLKLPLTAYSDWVQPWKDIPSYDDFLRKICEFEGISEEELSANLLNGKIELSLEIHTEGRSTSI